MLGLNLSLKVMETRLSKIWNIKGKVQIVDMSKGYFLVHFSDVEDYRHVLFEGPWMIVAHYLIVQRWRPFFLSSEKDVQKIAAWVRIPYLPIELYNQEFLSRVGSKIGKMLKVDQLTSIHSRGKFARICVQIDLKKKFVPTVKVMGKVLNLEYEGLHQICFNCGNCGHRVGSFPEITVTEEQKNKNQESAKIDEENPNYEDHCQGGAAREC